jgi:hypothetical protein
MTDAKIHFKVGQIEFSGEGSTEWLAKQLDKVIEKAPQLVNLTPASEGTQAGTGNQPLSSTSSDASIAQQTLALFLREKNATSNQTKKFLATAIWLKAKGQNRIKTGDVVRAISSANQERLKNASLCLRRNITKGHCDRDSQGVYVTDKGKSSI